MARRIVILLCILFIIFVPGNSKAQFNLEFGTGPFNGNRFGTGMFGSNSNSGGGGGIPNNAMTFNGIPMTFKGSFMTFSGTP